MAISGSNPIPDLGASGVGPLQPGANRGPGKAGGPSAGGGPSFTDVLRNSIREVNDLQRSADAAIRELTLGNTNNVTEVVNQVEKADLAFRALLAVRNKLVDAYEEISRLRV